MRILVLSDTHIPRAADDLPDAVYREAKRVDLILHAGDFVEMSVLDKLRKICEVKAVRGNMDEAKLREVLKDKEVIDVEGASIALIHGHGPKTNLVETVRREFTNVNAIVFGHSHSPFNEVRDGILFFNPGSSTDTIFASENSYGIIEVKNRAIKGKIIRL